MSDNRLPRELSNKSQIDAFLTRCEDLRREKAAGAERGRLLFALDATGSRQPTWDRAAHLQCEMFVAAAGLGGLEVQLAFYRGFGEFKASPWLTQPQSLLRMMTSVSCRAGRTQIGRVLQHCANETKRKPVAALVFVGDAMEEELDPLAHLAGGLGALGVRAFMFHEGGDAVAETAFREVARLTSGAYCRFDHGSADQLRALLSAVAVYAAGGRPALEDYASRRSQEVKMIARQLRS